MVEDADLRAALARRDQAVRTGNRTGYGDVVTDDLINVTASGEVESKTARMAFIGTTGNVIEEENAGFRSYGDDTVIYTYDGTGTPRIFVSEVWVKTPAGWRMAHRQSTWK